MKDILILYHAECPDGFGAAWAAWKKFGDSAEYTPVSHGVPMREGIEDKEIYFIDFAYSEKETANLISKNKRVTIIDHHITNERAAKMTQNYLYSIDNSGSVLAWKYFHSDKPIPKALEYIEDRDLWRFKVGNSDALCTYIDSFDFDFNVWDQLISDLEDDNSRNQCLIKGEAMLKHQTRLIDRIIEDNAKLVSFEGHEVYVVNAIGEFASHICSALYKKKPPFAISWFEGKDGVHVSLRSDGSIDVDKMAKKFGGGGHKASAGFELPSINLFPWKIK